MRYLGTLWGIGGVFMLLTYAVLRIFPVTVEAFTHQLAWYHWLVLLVNTLFLAYLKAYRGFQLGLVPRILQRAAHIYEEPTLLRSLLAPLYCIGYFQTTRKVQIVTIGMTVAMVAMIVSLRFLPQPWRGIIDFGIVAALSWGALLLLLSSVQAFIAVAPWKSSSFDYTNP